jgi:hypothetical protein
MAKDNIIRFSRIGNMMEQNGKNIDCYHQKIRKEAFRIGKTIEAEMKAEKASAVSIDMIEKAHQKNGFDAHSKKVQTDIKRALFNEWEYGDSYKTALICSERVFAKDASPKTPAPEIQKITTQNVIEFTNPKTHSNAG